MFKNVNQLDKHFLKCITGRSVGNFIKTNDPISFIRNSDVLYVEKKRATSVLRTIGFHMPIELTKSGFIGSISYKGQNVNIFGEKFSKIFSEGNGKYSDRDPDSVSNRSLLANAFKSMLTNKNRLYKTGGFFMGFVFIFLVTFFGNIFW